MIRRLRAFGGPVERNGMALLLASGLASGLGFLFWALAARLYDTAEVGTATALVSSMTFLGNVATLGLRNGLLRFASRGGESGLRLTRRIYLICAAAGALAAAIFIAGQPLWASELTILTSSPLWMILFAMATMGWTLFVLQDGTLTAFDRTSLVPAVQLSYGVGKVLMLFALVSVSGGVFLAFSAPAFCAVLVVSALILRRSAGAPRANAAPDAQLPRLPDLMRFAAAEHLSALVWLAAVNLLPLIILQQAGAKASAYYYISFTTAYFLYLVSSNFGSALLVAGSRDQEGLMRTARRALRNALLLVVAGAIVGVIAAPFFLGILGKDYAAHAQLLQILLISAIPNTVVGIAQAVARARLKLVALAAQQVSVSVLVLAGSVIALHAGGVDGVGWAWLIAQSIVALGVLATTLRPLWLEIVPLPVLSMMDRWRQALIRIPRGRRARAAAAAVAASTGSKIDQVRLLATSNSVIVAAARSEEEPVVIRLAVNARARASMFATATVQELIASDPRLDDRLQQLIPRVRAKFDHPAVVIEDRRPGESWPESRDQSEGLWMLATAVADMHSRTAVVSTGEHVAREFDERMTALRRVPAGDGRLTRLVGMAHAIRHRLAGTELTLGVVHGDCAMGNALFSPDGGPSSDDVMLTGLIDWENARLLGIPELDLAHLWLTSRGGEIGAALAAAMESPGQWEAWLVEQGIPRANPQLSERLLLVAAWLEHVVGEVARTGRGVTTTWTSRNVDLPLDRVLGTQREDAI